MCYLVDMAKNKKKPSSVHSAHGFVIVGEGPSRRSLAAALASARGGSGAGSHRSRAHDEAQGRARRPKHGGKAAFIDRDNPRDSRGRFVRVRANVGRDTLERVKRSEDARELEQAKRWLEAKITRASRAQYTEHIDAGGSQRTFKLDVGALPKPLRAAAAAVRDGNLVAFRKAKDDAYFERLNPQARRRKKRTRLARSGARSA